MRKRLVEMTYREYCTYIGESGLLEPLVSTVEALFVWVFIRGWKR